MPRASQSFQPDEIKVLDFVMHALLRGGDARMATRHDAFFSLCKKIGSMKKQIEVQHAAEDSEVAE